MEIVKQYRHKTILRYYNPQNFRSVIFTEYHFKGTKFKVRELSKNQRNKAKRYGKSFKRVLIQNHNFKHFSKKPILKRQHENGLKIYIDGQPVRFKHFLKYDYLTNTTQATLSKVIFNYMDRNTKISNNNQ